MGRMNRRKFIGTALAGTLATDRFLHRSSAGEGQKPKLKLGLIGCGGYGMVDVRAAFKTGGVEVIALCDVDSQHLTDSANAIEKIQGSRPKTFKHYEELLETAGLNAVIIATPPTCSSGRTVRPGNIRTRAEYRWFCVARRGPLGPPGDDEDGYLRKSTDLLPVSS
jgi:hypothetical protein